MNFVVGFAGGFYNAPDKPSAEAPVARVLRWGLFIANLALVVLTLWALVWLASETAQIQVRYSALTNLKFAGVKDVVATLGVIHLGLLGGFLAGLSLSPKEH